MSFDSTRVSKSAFGRVRPLFAATLSISVLMLVSLPAHAYIDPNTGGFLFQILAPLFALVVSAWLFFADKLKSAWARAKELMGFRTLDR